MSASPAGSSYTAEVDCARCKGSLQHLDGELVSSLSRFPVLQACCSHPATERVLTVRSSSEEFRPVITALRKPHVNIITRCSNHWQIS